MNASAKPRLVSFKLCPFVQRSVITLLHKGVDFDIEYIDLADKPDWFLEISPLGKVPVLRVGSESLFESAVINEYLDETTGDPLHPTDPLARAKNRAWIEFGSGLLGAQYRACIAKDEDALDKALEDLDAGLARVAGAMAGPPYFNGGALSLVDTAYAPLFMRQALLAERTRRDPYGGQDKIRGWAEALLGLEAVEKSVVPEFPKLFAKMLGPALAA